MGRPEGSRNAGYEEERERLARLLLERLRRQDGPQTSFRKLATACGVSPPTLRHYFGDREGAIIAAMQLARDDGASYLKIIADDDLGNLREALTTLLRNFVLGWERFQLGDIARFGLEAGLGARPIGEAFLGELWEPVLDAFARRLNVHIKRGELRCCDPRHAALSLLGPVFMALIHQRELGGEEVAELEVYALLEMHLDGFLRAFACGPAPREE